MINFTGLAVEIIIQLSLRGSPIYWRLFNAIVALLLVARFFAYQLAFDLYNPFDILIALYVCAVGLFQILYINGEWEKFFYRRKDD
jgi:hypothetical protein